ncbi:MAG TPA: YbaB/EbfC family nucleoid-associated protein [Planctomycetaceae bacterium]|nr:YbaB/EbfC family nucleoid-associated protein [Planctomycetaceae bacterium]
MSGTVGVKKDLNMFGGLKNLASIMQQAGEIKGKVAAAKERVSKLRSEGSAGPDLVRIVVSGEMTVLSVSIEQNLIASGNRQMIEQLVNAATNDALQKSKAAAAAIMAEIAEGMDVPGLQDAMAKMGMG